jgi:hypothetical protein
VRTEVAISRGEGAGIAIVFDLWVGWVGWIDGWFQWCEIWWL